MNRRNFLKNMASYAALYGSGLGANFAFSDAHASSIQRTLINIMLTGGADFRYLLAPVPGTAYADIFWSARKSLYRYTAADQAAYNTYEDVWNDLYLPVNYSGMTFGIHRDAGWLKTQFELGNVAIVSNVVGSTNRRHDHSRLILNAGNLETGMLETDHDGWGGRLVNSIGSSNVISAASSVPVFCNSSNLGNINENVVHVKDTRNYALSGEDNEVTSNRSVIARALKDYYSVRGQEIEGEISAGNLSETWPFRRYFKHERSLRNFGDKLAQRLGDVGALPIALKGLTIGGSALNNISFGQQCSNIYDCLLAQDVLSLRAAYIEYPGWDTHTNQKKRIEKNFQDVFGNNGGLSILMQELENVTGANDHTSYVFTTDFGRQLAANGTGTDHGRGNYMILIGNAVQGGVYGDMFPSSEIETDAAGDIPYEKVGADIKGKTSFERVLAEACNWVEPGSGENVFPDAGKRIIEETVDLSTLFL